jgi:hypothetical protein
MLCFGCLLSSACVGVSTAGELGFAGPCTAACYAMLASCRCSSRHTLRISPAIAEASGAQAATGPEAGFRGGAQARACAAPLNCVAIHWACCVLYTCCHPAIAAWGQGYVQGCLATRVLCPSCTAVGYSTGAISYCLQYRPIAVQQYYLQGCIKMVLLKDCCRCQASVVVLHKGS